MMMNNDYIESNTRVNTIDVVDSLDLKPWINKYDSSDTRYYLNIKDLQHICLKQTYYKTGNVSGVEYIDSDGETVTVAHGRFYNRYYNKTYIDRNGIVHTNWRPYGNPGENFAECVAVVLAKRFGSK